MGNQMIYLKFTEDLQSLLHLWKGQPPKLFRIDPSRYNRIFTKYGLVNNVKAYKALTKHIPPYQHGRIMQSLHCMLLHSVRLFPAFTCMLSEFINEEWLSLVDIGHKPFHRDHIVHQPQVALVLKRLFHEVCYDPASNAIANMLTKHKELLPYVSSPCWIDGKKRRPMVSLLDLTAFTFAEGARELDYLFSFAESQGIRKKALTLDRDDPAEAFLLWKRISYNAGITAALYHDIGYPVQFLSTLGKAVDHSSFGKLLSNINAQGLSNYFRNNLCLMPLKAYSHRDSFPFPHNFYNEYEECLGEALRETHGLPGALTFLYLNNEVREFDMHRENPLNLLTMEMAALAIVMHDMLKIYGSADRLKTKTGHQLYSMCPKRPYLRLSFSKDPISFLLTLADQIQAYGRPNSHFEVSGRRRKTNIVLMHMEERITETQVQWDPTDQSLGITYCFDENHPLPNVKQSNEFNPKTEAEYYDPFTGYLDYHDLFSRVVLGVN